MPLVDSFIRPDARSNDMSIQRRFPSYFASMMRTVLFLLLMTTPRYALGGEQDVTEPIVSESTVAEPGWGYPYDSLMADLDQWRGSPFVWIDSIGTSAQQRPLWELTISDPTSSQPRQRVFVHTRTHPNEVQTSRVVNAMIKLLLSDEPEYAAMRTRLVVHIVPMYNPDGVELGYGRENANGIDLERNWDKDAMEPESAALRRRFEVLMNTPMPIRLALNLHSAGACRRHFIVHDATGTSREYFRHQINFVNNVRVRWPDGIAPWDYAITWVNQTPTHFPESWWWRSHDATVLALTYEDMNCASAGNYDSTAMAILGGIARQLALPSSAGDRIDRERAGSAHIEYVGGDRVVLHLRVPSPRDVTLELFTLHGERIEAIGLGRRSEGWHDYELSQHLPPGFTIVSVHSGTDRIDLGAVR